MKILLAVDGSAYTRKMLDYVAAHRALFDDAHEYTVLNVQPLLPNHAASAVGTQAAQDYYQDEARQVIEPAVAALQSAGLRATGAWKAGPIGETIGEFADRNHYDLVVMGSHGHGALARLVMGSVASRVLAQSGVPVLLVR